MIPNKKARKRRCFRRSAGFPHFILFSNKTRQPFSQAGRTSAALFPKSTNKFYAFYLDNLTRRNHPDTMYFLQSLKKKGLLGCFSHDSKPKNARCPARFILFAKHLRPQAEKFLLLARLAPCYDRQRRKRQKGAAFGAWYSDGLAYIKAYKTLFTLYIEVRTSQFWGKKVPMFQ